MAGPDDPRYNNTYKWGDVEFTLPYFSIDEDDSWDFIIKILEQAIRDFINLENSTTPIEQYYYITAKAMIFDSDYRIDYGGIELSLEEILSSVFNTNVEYFREETLRRRDLAKQKKKKRR